MTKDSAEQSMMLTGVAFLILFAVVVGGIMLATLWWTRDDARRRGVSPWIAVPIVALGFWPLGLWLWMKFRPPTPEELAEQKAAAPPDKPGPA
jgi:H+/Cl- antiporter ClcA